MNDVTWTCSRCGHRAEGIGEALPEHWLDAGRFAFCEDCRDGAVVALADYVDQISDRVDAAVAALRERVAHDQQQIAQLLAREAERERRWARSALSLKESTGPGPGTPGT